MQNRIFCLLECMFTKHCCGSFVSLHWTYVHNRVPAGVFTWLLWIPISEESALWALHFVLCKYSRVQTLVSPFPSEFVGVSAYALHTWLRLPIIVIWRFWHFFIFCFVSIFNQLIEHVGPAKHTLLLLFLLCSVRSDAIRNEKAV